MSFQVTGIITNFLTVFIVQLLFLILFNVIRKNKLFANIRFIAIIAYTVVVIQLTLWPPAVGTPPVRWSDIPYNLIPFNSIKGSLNHFYYMVGIRNILGNIVLLLPLAFLIRLKHSMKAVLIGFSISLSIEILQVVLTMSRLITTRSFDVDDLILNTTGFYIGYLINHVAGRLRRRISSSKDLRVKTVD